MAPSLDLPPAPIPKSTSNPVNKSRSLPLGTILIVPFVLQIVTAVGLVGYLSFRNGQRAVEDLAHQLMGEVGDQISAHLATYLAAPHVVNQLNQVALDLGQLDLQDLAGMERHFWRQSQIFDRISYIQFGDKNGEFVGLAVNDYGTFAYQVTETTGALQTYTIDATGQRGRLQETSPNFDARLRPWYIVPREADKPAWTDIYAWVNPPTLAITLGQPYYDGNGNFQGILATDLTIAQISDFLGDLDIGNTGQTFILERSGLMIATSSGERPFVLEPEGPQRLGALDSQNDLTRATVNHLFDRFGSLGMIDGREQLRFEIAGQRHFLQVNSLRDQQGLDWVSVVVVPEAEFMANIIANTRTTIGLCAIALIGAILIGIRTSQWVTRPILRLNQAAKEIAQGQWSQDVALEHRSRSEKCPQISGS